jgi:hypothetical protein
MKHVLFGFALCFLSLNSFAAKKIECNSNLNFNLKLTIYLDTGTATLYNCTDSPCSGREHKEVSEKAVLKMTSPNAKFLHYVITSGEYPAKEYFDVVYPSPMNAPIEISFDGDSSLYTCF